MLRRAFVALIVVLSTFGGLALPAEATEDAATCRLYADPLTQTKATICVDVTSSNRRVYVRGESVFSPTTLTVNWAVVEQYTPSTGETVWVVDDCCGWSRSSTLGYVVYLSTPAPVQFGHLYRACASVGVRDGLLGPHNFGWICSGYRAN